MIGIPQKRKVVAVVVEVASPMTDVFPVRRLQAV